MTTRFITIEQDDAVTTVTLNREDKRNCINEDMLEEMDQVFRKPPQGTRCFVLAAKGPHFCAGLDLKEHFDKDRSPIEFMRVCQNWHKAFDQIQLGGTPVVAVLQGAVVGGGLELAAATHVRIAEPSAFFALPEGQRGIFTGGGATVRVARIITAPRMVDMMLAARTFGRKKRVGTGPCPRIGRSGSWAAAGQGTGQADCDLSPDDQFRHHHRHCTHQRHVRNGWLVCRGLVASRCSNQSRHTGTPCGLFWQTDKTPGTRCMNSVPPVSAFVDLSKSWLWCKIASRELLILKKYPV